MSVNVEDVIFVYLTLASASKFYNVMVLRFESK